MNEKGEDEEGEVYLVGGRLYQMKLPIISTLWAMKAAICSGSASSMCSVKCERGP